VFFWHFGCKFAKVFFHTNDREILMSAWAPGTTPNRPPTLVCHSCWSWFHYESRTPGTLATLLVTLKLRLFWTLFWSYWKSELLELYFGHIETRNTCNTFGHIGSRNSCNTLFVTVKVGTLSITLEIGTLLVQFVWAKAGVEQIWEELSLTSCVLYLQFFVWGRKKGPVVLKRSPARESRKGAQLCILPISLVMVMKFAFQSTYEAY
jgi:hypothetical protein